MKLHIGRSLYDSCSVAHCYHKVDRERDVLAMNRSAVICDMFRSMHLKTRKYAQFLLRLLKLSIPRPPTSPEAPHLPPEL